MGKELGEKNGNSEKLREIYEKAVSKNKLFIKRVPEKAKKRFQEFADEEFDGDFGFALKHLMDFYDGLLSSPNKILLEQITSMAEEIESLKVVPKEEPKKKVIRSVGGTIISEKVIK